MMTSACSRPAAKSKKSQTTCRPPPSAAGGPDSSPSSVPPPKPEFVFLPALVHCTINMFVPAREALRVMETCRFASEMYGLCSEEVVMRKASTSDRVDIYSILMRCPNLLKLSVPLCENIHELVEAVASGLCDKLQVLEVLHNEISPWPADKDCLAPLFDVLGHGACPNITHLSFRVLLCWQPLSELLLTTHLGWMLRSRIEKGCHDLRVLDLHKEASYTIRDLYEITSILSSGACETLEELRLGSCWMLQGSAVADDLRGWLMNTNLPHLRVFIAPHHPRGSIGALLHPRWAPGLQHLEYEGITDIQPILELLVVIERGTWPDLRKLRILGSTYVEPVSPMLMQALCVGASALQSLALENFGCIYGAVDMAEGLKGGACPRLAELSLNGGLVYDKGLMELARAFEGGAPCNTTLRKLDLGSCRIHTPGVEELARAMTQGALSYLEELDLSGNYIYDAGVTRLTEAMESGALRELKVLNLASICMRSPREVGIASLCRALIDYHACPHLIRLDLRDDGRIDNDSERGLVERLNATRGQGKVKVEFIESGWTKVTTRRKKKKNEGKKNGSIR